MLVCAALVLALMPVGFAPKAQAATESAGITITASQTLQERRQTVYDYMLSMATVMVLLVLLQQ